MQAANPSAEAQDSVVEGIPIAQGFPVNVPGATFPQAPEAVQDPTYEHVTDPSFQVPETVLFETRKRVQSNRSHCRVQP